MRLNKTTSVVCYNNMSKYILCFGNSFYCFMVNDWGLAIMW